MEQEMKTIN